MKDKIKFDYDAPPMRDESIFWGEDDFRWSDKNNDKPASGRVLDMENDSFVWCFTGPRGAGKTSYMTYIAEKLNYLYGKRIISNYPISLDVRHKDMTVTNIRSENLDLGKMFNFDGAYQDSLIVLDEAPQVINRLATMSWKNRLLDLYLQKIRHDNISFLYGSQNESLDHGWVDASLRFQTDILVYCRDASRRYPNAGYKRGSMILATMIDKSGMWTGFRYDERPRTFRRRVLTELIWGTFDTHQQFDVFESLRGVSIDLEKTKITDKTDEIVPVGVVEKTRQILETGVASGKMKMIDLYTNIGDLDQKMKRAIGNALTKAGIRRYAGGWFDFSNFDMEKFHL